MAVDSLARSAIVFIVVITLSHDSCGIAAYFAVANAADCRHWRSSALVSDGIAARNSSTIGDAMSLYAEMPVSLVRRVMKSDIVRGIAPPNGASPRGRTERTTFSIIESSMVCIAQASPSFDSMIENAEGMNEMTTPWGLLPVRLMIERISTPQPSGSSSPSR